MEVIDTIIALRQFLDSQNDVKSIGFVPTMGALHQGHLSLIQRSKSENDLTICSIFVNPAQFNDPEDLKKYPRPIVEDIQKLKDSGCDVLFAPFVSEIYPSTMVFDSMPDIGILSEVLEAQHRPGHFDGVMKVVKRLFEIVKPDRAYFGEKDFQQLKVIQEMVKILQMNITIIPCKTIREYDGLAMSSRNVRLNIGERAKAAMIPTVLFELKKFSLCPAEPLDTIKQKLINQLNAISDVRVQYLEVIDENTFEKISDWAYQFSKRALIAVHVGNIRLIDNIEL